MEYKAKKVHFIGIGGIGMSALAQLFLDHGAHVTGSDRDASPVTELLEKKGIKVIIGQKAENVPMDADAVIYSDAVPEDNPERTRARELGIRQVSYFEMLGKVSEGLSTGSGQGRKTIAVAGTHGKTTTTGMLAKILKDAGASPTAVVGSLVKDFDSNYLHGDSDLFVVEACEYKDHLLKLLPQVLVITNLEWDHTDYFPSLAALQETFRKAIERVPENGTIVTDPANPNIAPLLANAKAKVIDYTKEPAYTLTLPGEFNVMNARAAAATARAVLPNITDKTIKNALKDFHGTWRRFEYKGKTKKGADVYDDYAHHPTAIKETLRAFRAKTKGKVFVAFHPHLYSRTKDLFEEFSAAFTDADEVLIAPIYAARETDDGTVSSAMLAEAIAKNGVLTRAATFAEIENELEAKPRAGDAVICMGAGDIYKVADRLVACGK